MQNHSRVSTFRCSGSTKAPRKVLFLRWESDSSPPNPQTGRPPPVGCPHLLIQYIRPYPPHLQAVSSNSNPRTRHVMVTTDSETASLNNLKRCPFLCCRTAFLNNHAANVTAASVWCCWELLGTAELSAGRRSAPFPAPMGVRKKGTENRKLCVTVRRSNFTSIAFLKPSLL
jgi:hypothetical protein